MADEKYMRLALEIARKGEGFVEPNPLVGAVIVKNNKIIGRGYHSYFAGPHAEINAINSVRNPKHLKGATLYINLEPCTYFGKTPPCAPAIVQSGIKKVVIASRDPNPLVNGKGIRFLKQHGISVTEGIMGDEARNINKPFFKLHQKGLPYIVAKWAMSLDGKLATKTGDSKWITSEKSRLYARGIRAKMNPALAYGFGKQEVSKGWMNGVMVGIGTVLKDNPRLLAKSIEHRANSKKNSTLYALRPTSQDNPVRIILDSRARLPLTSNLVRTLDRGDVYLMVSSSAPVKNVRLLEQKGVRVFKVPSNNKRLNFMAVLKILARNGVNKIMIEGGGEVLGTAFDYKIVDEVYAFIAPKIIGGIASKTPIEGLGTKKIINALNLKEVTIKYLKPDILVHGFCD